MIKVFDKRAKKHEIAVEKMTLEALLNKHGLAGKLDDVALFNWGTKDKREIRRALVELVGCSKLDDEPLKCELDPDLGPAKVIYAPKPWKPEQPLDLEKTHTLKIKRRFPVPAVSITKLKPWFKLGTESCDLEYMLEGVSARASKVDFEVHATHYYEIALTDPGDISLPKEPYEKPCDTTNEAGTTQVFQKKKVLEVNDKLPPTGAQAAPTWKGESEATKGILKKGTTYEHFGCAPYQALVRYYKDDADAKAKLLLEPWGLRWKHKSGAPLDPDSLVVTWTIADDNDKLERGQIQVWDKDDKLVFFAPLDKAKLRVAKKYDLGGDLQKKWDTSTIDRTKMPYRIQIQAHSGEDKEKGLALAVMPTLVRDYRYAKIQLIAFDVKPGTHAGAYLGDSSDETDIAARCDAMKEAIQKAHGAAETAADVLKVFMAPEFYFRGQKGGYPIEKIYTIVSKMREETDKLDYADWLFVFGTAIGYLRQGEVIGSGPKTHGGDATYEVKITDIDTSDPTDLVITLATTPSSHSPPNAWTVTQGSVSAAKVKSSVGAKLRMDGKPALAIGGAKLCEPFVWIEAQTTGAKTELTVISPVCAQIVSTTASAAQWTIEDSAKVQDKIETCQRLGGGKWKVTLAGNGTFTLGKAELIAPKATEVFNLALLQRGWPAPHLGDRWLERAVVYKENVSWIDFLGPNYANDAWKDPSGQGRVIKIYDGTDRVALPTSGSRDTLGATPNQGSEINESGVGGRSVVTFDDITFGVEVCLDHYRDRIHNYYNGGPAAKGDPKVQVHLIPSWGSSIGAGKICWPATNGLAFNVDGSDRRSAARVNDGKYDCDDHPGQNLSGPGVCAKEVVSYYCPKCGAWRSGPGTCLQCTGPLTVYHMCGYPAWSFSGKSPYVTCGTCSHSEWVIKGPGPSSCSKCKATNMICDQYYVHPGPCPSHPSLPAVHKKCSRPFEQLGSLIAPTGKPIAVKASENKTYFEEKGEITVYEAKAVPTAEFVP
jgi:hypothetical protein